MDTLESLAAEAGEIGAAPAAPGDAPGAAPGQQPPGPPEVDNLGAMMMAAALLRVTLAETPVLFDPPLRWPATHLADDKLPALLGPWARVLDHYGVRVPADMTHPVLMAVLTTGPAIWAMGQAIRAEHGARNRTADTVARVDDPARPE